jgi:hypothetical protein
MVAGPAAKDGESTSGDSAAAELAAIRNGVCSRLREPSRRRELRVLILLRGVSTRVDLEIQQPVQADREF